MLYTDCNAPPTFTKHVTKVESQEVWLPVVLVEIRKTHVHQTGSGINLHYCTFAKIV